MFHGWLSLWFWGRILSLHFFPLQVMTGKNTKKAFTFTWELKGISTVIKNALCYSKVTKLVPSHAGRFFSVLWTQLWDAGSLQVGRSTLSKGGWFSDRWFSSLWGKWMSVWFTVTLVILWFVASSQPPGLYVKLRCSCCFSAQISPPLFFLFTKHFFNTTFGSKSSSFLCSSLWMSRDIGEVWIECVGSEFKHDLNFEQSTSVNGET